MKQFRLAVATLIATWILLLIGGVVNPTGSSLACPDWYFVPTCNGELLPEMKGGVLYEHGHRLWASWVGLLTVILAISTVRSRRSERRTVQLALAAVVLVAFQGALGGITVLVKLNPIISTLHLATAMGFFCLLVLLCFRLWPAGRVFDAAPPLPRWPVAVAALLTLGQILLGGAVRHYGAGLICGNDWIGCGPWWTELPRAYLHVAHRVAGVVLTIVIVWAGARAARAAKQGELSLALRIAWLPTALVVIQVAIGLYVVARRPLLGLTLHTAVPALILGGLVAAYLALGPDGRRIDQGGSGG